MTAIKLNPAEVQRVLSPVHWNITQWLWLPYSYISHYFQNFALFFYMMLRYATKLHFKYFLFSYIGIYKTHGLEKKIKKSGAALTIAFPICMSVRCLEKYAAFFSGERTGKDIREATFWLTVVTYIP